ncbi:dTDP-glucose 4,6-dehydratase [Candidatus Roizmanbacteria bacterium]|nr:dTDP-glucose 4,6-dehydratase [Candidatus Roizmanbacteria bacterium]
MKLLVTGGAGFIGANFILYWLANHPDDDVVNLDKLTYAGNTTNLKSVETQKNYHFVKGDICDADLVNKTIRDRQIDVIVHFAAESHVDRSILDPAPFIKTNVVGTYVLLQAALNNRLSRFHHVSTDEVFGDLPLKSEEKFTPTSNYNPRSPYAASKAGSDHLVRAFYETYRLPVTISNCSNNFGPFQFPEKLIPLAVTNLLEGKKVPVYGDGQYVRDWLYVEDHCRGIDVILERGTVGKTYLLGGLTEDIANIEVVKKIIKIMGKDETAVEHVADRPGHDRRYAVDWSLTEKELGWRPRHSFDEALSLTVDWYTNRQDWWKGIKYSHE